MKKEKRIKVSAIIVSYNTKNLLENCLDFLESAMADIFHEVIVVDNASTDGTVELIKSKYRNVLLIENSINEGFARANNQGIKRAKGEYVLLLNSDAEVEKESMSKLTEALDKGNGLAACGPKLLNSDLSLQPSCGFLPTIGRVFLWMFFIDDIPVINNLIFSYHEEKSKFYERNNYVEWISGACVLIRKKIFSEVGFFDDNIFMYGEEVDLFIRIKQAGYRNIFVSDAIVRHLKGKSSDGKDSGILEEFTSLIYLYKKYSNFLNVLLLRILLISGALLRIFVFGIIRRYPKRINLYVKAIEAVRR